MATKKTKKDHDLSSAQKVGIGVGLTAAAVTAAGAYFLYGSKEANKNRKKVKSWALKAKGEILETLEKAEHITEEEYKALVDGVLSTYGKVQTLSQNEMKDFKKEMRDSWQDIVKNGAQTAGEVQSIVKKVTARSKKTAKKAAKKAVKKATKKTAKKAPKKAAKKAAKKTTKKAAKK